MYRLAVVLFGLLLLFAPTRSSAQVLVRNAVADYLATSAADPARKAELGNFKGLLVADIAIHRGLPPVRFISLPGRLGKNGNLWSAYLPVKAGYLCLPGPLEGSIGFSPDFLFLGCVREIHDYGLLAFDPEHGEVALYRMRARRIEKRHLHSKAAFFRQLWDRYIKHAGAVKGGHRLVPEHFVRRLTLENLRKQGVNVAGIKAAPPLPAIGGP